MMTAYILKLLVLVPLVAGLAFGALWLWRKAQPGAFRQRDRMVKLVEATPLGATARLAVVEFADRRLLLAVSRSGISLLADAPLDGRGEDAPAS
jgi:flagellar protein FliO/FliZ